MGQPCPTRLTPAPRAPAESGTPSLPPFPQPPPFPPHQPSRGPSRACTLCRVLPAPLHPPAVPGRQTPLLTGSQGDPEAARAAWCPRSGRRRCSPSASRPLHNRLHKSGESPAPGHAARVRWRWPGPPKPGITPAPGWAPQALQRELAAAGAGPAHPVLSPCRSSGRAPSPQPGAWMPGLQLLGSRVGALPSTVVPQPREGLPRRGQPGPGWPWSG